MPTIIDCYDSNSSDDDTSVDTRDTDSVFNSDADSDEEVIPPLISRYNSDSNDDNNNNAPPIAHTCHTARIRNMHTDVTTPLQIYMSNDPFENVIAVDISTHGNHKTLGMIINNNSSMGN